MMMSTSSRRSSVGSGNQKPDPTKGSKQDHPTPHDSSSNEVHQAPANESGQQLNDQAKLQEQSRDRQGLEEPGDERTSKDAHTTVGNDPNAQQPDASVVQQRGQLRETIRIILQQIQDGIRDEDQGHDELTRLREQLLRMDKFRPLSVSTEEEPTQPDQETPQREGQTASSDELTRPLVVKLEQSTTTIRSQDRQTTPGADNVPIRSKNDIRMALAMAYVDQSVTTTKVTALTIRQHDDDYSTNDAQTLLAHEEQLRTNMDHIKRLEDDLARTTSDESFGYFRIPNIPSSAHKSRLLPRQLTYETKQHQGQETTPLEHIVLTEPTQESDNPGKENVTTTIRRQVHKIFDKVQQMDNGTTVSETACELGQLTAIDWEECEAIPDYIKNIPPMVFAGKPTQSATKFLAQMDRYLTRAGVDTEEEMVDQLHLYLSDEVRTSLLNVLTEETEYDYRAQAEFLTQWWQTNRDPRPLRDAFQKIKLSPTEDIDSYASRIARGRRAGWPHESQQRHNGFHSEFEKAIMDRFVAGLPASIRQIIQSSGKLDDIELHQSNFTELKEFTRIQLRKARKKCTNCNRTGEHMTRECPYVSCVRDDKQDAHHDGTTDRIYNPALAEDMRMIQSLHDLRQKILSKTTGITEQEAQSLLREVSQIDRWVETLENTRREPHDDIEVIEGGDNLPLNY